MAESPCTDAGTPPTSTVETVVLTLVALVVAVRGTSVFEISGARRIMATSGTCGNIRLVKATTAGCMTVSAGKDDNVICVRSKTSGRPLTDCNSKRIDMSLSGRLANIKPTSLSSVGSTVQDLSAALSPTRRNAPSGTSRTIRRCPGPAACASSQSEIGMAAITIPSPTIFTRATSGIGIITGGSRPASTARRNSNASCPVSNA